MKKHNKNDKMIKYLADGGAAVPEVLNKPVSRVNPATPAAPIINPQPAVPGGYGTISEAGVQAQKTGYAYNPLPGTVKDPFSYENSAEGKANIEYLKRMQASAGPTPSAWVGKNKQQILANSELARLAGGYKTNSAAFSKYIDDILSGGQLARNEEYQRSLKEFQAATGKTDVPMYKTEDAGIRQRQAFDLNLSLEQALAMEQEARARAGIQAAAGEMEQVSSQQSDLTKLLQQQAGYQAATGPADINAAFKANLAQQATNENYGPSLAQYNLKLAQDRNLMQQLALAQMQRGGGTAAASRQLMNLQQEGATQAAQAAAQAAFQEQEAQKQRQVQYAGLLGEQESLAAQQQFAGQEAAKVRQQEYSTLLSQQLQSQRAAAQSAMSDYEDLFQQRIAEGMTIQQAQQQAKADYEKLLTGQLMGEKQIASQEWMAKKQGQQQLIGGILGGAAAVGAGFAKSDRRAKKDISSGSKDVAEFLNKLEAYSYKYKNTDEPFTKKGKQTSVMAQDLEKSVIGKQMVIDTDEGKIVDYAAGLPAMLAAQVELNKRLNRLEKKGKNNKKDK